MWGLRSRGLGFRCVGLSLGTCGSRDLGSRGLGGLGSRDLRV